MGLESILSSLALFLTAGLVVYVQLAFWFPSYPVQGVANDEDSRKTETLSKDDPRKDEASKDHPKEEEEAANGGDSSSPNQESKKESVKSQEAEEKASKSSPKEENEDIFAMNNNNWRCACEGGFLPPGMFGGAEAVMRMGVGQCYHKKM
jgi:hypothetical protein